MEPAKPLTTPKSTRRKLLPRRVVEGARGVLVVIALVAGLAYFISTVDDHYPVEHWLFWIYLKNWGWCALFGLACLSVGHAVMSALLPVVVPLRERVVLAFPLGCLVFFLGMFGGGLLGLYGPAFAIALPLVLVAVGVPSAVRRLRRSWRHLCAFRRRPSPRPAWWFYPALAFGLGGLGLVYFSILSPQNIAFDSHFYHLGLAQEYAVEGAIARSPVGWTPAALPHLASVLYTWCLIVPGFDFFGRLTCAAHLEFTVFLFTLAGIPVLVRWLVPGSRAALGWVAVFLFPGILLYDSSLTVAADHIAALFAVPVFLALRRAYRAVSLREGVLLAAMLSGALLTKYQGIYVLAFPVLALMVRTLWLIARPRGASTRWRPLVGLSAAGAAGLVLTAPHWLKNWLWYGDPLFPLLHRHFEPTAWAPEAGRIFDEWTAYQSKDWVTPGTTGERLHEAAKALYTFSFEPHDWPRFHGEVPVFGSLFTLSLLALPFLRGTKRTWSLMVATHLGIFAWFWTLPQDRYLQLLLPWMAAATAATLAMVWRTHVSAKVAVSLLVGAQVVWGGDVYFIPGHAMTRESPAVTTAELLAQGHRGNYEGRLVQKGELFAIGRDLPPDARVLLHEENRRLGLWRPVIADITGWQLALRYDTFESPAALDQRLRELGVTHIVTRPGKSRRLDTLGGDLRFFDYLQSSAKLVKRYGGFAVYRLAEPAPTLSDRVAYLGCGKWYGRGLHRLGDLSLGEKGPAGTKLAPLEPAPASAEALEAFTAKADYLVVGSGCKPTLPRRALEDFVEIGKRGKEQLYVRQR